MFGLQSSAFQQVIDSVFDDHLRYGFYEWPNLSANRCIVTIQIDLKVRECICCTDCEMIQAKERDVFFCEHPFRNNRLTGTCCTTE